MWTSGIKYSKTFNWLIKLSLVLILLYVFYKQIIDRPNINDIIDEFKLTLTKSNYLYIIFIICLVPINWIFETYKWKSFMDEHASLGFMDAFKSILAGISLALITPNRIGEYGGRLLAIPAKYNWFSVMATLVGSVAQNLVTLILGLIGIFLLSDKIPFLENIDLATVYVFAIVFLLLTIYVFFNVDILLFVVNGLGIKKYFSRFAIHFGIVKRTSKVVLFKMLGISFFRYFIYATQYFLAAKFFGVDLAPLLILACICTILLIQSGIPLPPFLSVLARGEISLLVWGIFQLNELSILGMTFCIWLINLAVPALLGSIIVLNSDILQSLGYEKIKTSSLLLLLVIFSWTIVQVSSGFKTINFEDDICELRNNAFINGEKIVYKIYYNWKFIWVPAGEVSFLLSENESEYKVDIKGITYESYDSFFKVRDRYQTIIDKETLLPKTFVREIDEGGYVRYDSMSFDQKALFVEEHYGKHKDATKLDKFDLNNCTQDLVSVLYHLRNRDISNIDKGSKIPVSFFFSKKLYELDINVMDIKEKKIKNLGKFETIQARPELITGQIFDEDSYMDIWVSNDENKVPLLIESPIRIGSVKVVLKSYENLKYPLEKK